MISNWRRFSRWPVAEQRRFQSRRLAAFLREDLAPFSPFYARLLEEHAVDLDSIETLEDLERLPFTTKDQIVAALEKDPLALLLRPGEEGIRASWPWERKFPLAVRRALRGAKDARRFLEKEYGPVFMMATTGRTARPVPFLLTPVDLKRLATAGRRLANVLGITPRDRCVSLFPYAPHLAFWQVAFAGFESRLFILSTGGGKTIGTAGNLRAIARMKPAALFGVPCYVYHVLRCAAEEKVDLAGLRTITLGAERVTAGLRERLKELCARLGAPGVSVTGTYGFTEARTAWTECREGSGYHLYPDMEVFEIVDPATGRALGPGESGEIVYTSLDSRGTPVLRYRTGDWCEGGLSVDPCPHCGRTVPRLSSDITRLSQRTDFRLTKVKGTLVDLNHLAAVMNAVPSIEEWQVEIGKVNDDPDEVDRLVLRVAPSAGSRIDAKEIARLVFDATEVSPTRVEERTLAELVEALGLETEAKERRIVDRRPGGTGPGGARA